MRQHLAAELKVPSIDKLSLLRRVGMDCAGAVQFLEPEHTPDEGRIRPLSGDEVTALIADLPTLHIPDGAQLQASLAGIQEKVLLARLPNRSWGWPEGGAPSSHLVKPEPAAGAAVRHLVQTEAWALKVARTAGLQAAAAELAYFDDRCAIVIERYDRTPEGRRIHQEDFCQALSLEPGAKYESNVEYEREGSRLSRLASIAADRTADPTRFRQQLLELVTFNVVIGNGDAHSKNYSLLISERGEVSLAPLYDAAPVMYLDPRYKGTGHVLNGRTRIDRVGIEDLVAEAASWGLSTRRAEATVRDALNRIHDAVQQIALPDGAESVGDRLEKMYQTSMACMKQL